MNQDVTVLVALDYEHLGELELAWPLWAAHRPEIMEHQILFLCDGRESPGWWNRKISPVVQHPYMRVVPVDPIPGVSQRHLMLSAFVCEASQALRTPFWIKIDTDAASVERRPLYEQEWLQAMRDDGVVFVASPWSYTKTQQNWRDLQAWAATKPELRDKPEVPGTFGNKDRVHHKRIISFVMLGRTDFLQQCRELVGGPFLPIPSQDTVLWYLAHRLGLPYKRERMTRYGWRHGRKHLKAALAATQQPKPDDVPGWKAGG